MKLLFKLDRPGDLSHHYKMMGARTKDIEKILDRYLRRVSVAEKKFDKKIQAIFNQIRNRKLAQFKKEFNTP